MDPNAASFSWADATEEAEKLENEKKSTASPSKGGDDVAQVAALVEQMPKPSEDASLDEDMPAKTVLDRRGGLNEDDGEVEIHVESSDGVTAQAVTSFEDFGLSPELKQAVYDVGYNEPSAIQSRALPLILANRNVVGQAPTGTGKTAAFVLGALSKCDPNTDAPQALIVSPTRELTRQLYDVVLELGKFTKLKYQLVVPDASGLTQAIRAQVVIGTPGKLLDTIKQKSLNLRSVRIMVLDEADQMLGMQNLCTQVLRLKKSCPTKCQMLCFSATFDEKVKAFAKKVVPQPCDMLTLKRKKLSLDRIKQFWINCGSEQGKFDALSDIYGYLSIGQSIIFVHRVDTASELAAKMTAQGHKLSALHSRHKPAERDALIDAFRNGKTKVLISTNVLARGIDILQVSLIINYDLPLTKDNQPDPETYLHRIGRSGRWKNDGIAINFVHDAKSRRDLQVLDEAFPQPIHELQLDDIPKLDKMLRELKMSGTKKVQAESAALSAAPAAAATPTTTTTATTA
eukprot:CAMPEP_0174244426 /NCGR_PEP_ID=MMETSP0417-20130205/35225_1 /TAXON_ID=242541 /ORGANISM="Mayorella sp, Strain BSH-02190019" /LENGTH=514 /DNA_ID=CAMNT_0015324111 /DNA_START=39 /DNA_END=1580 /DNA_ORIENTATION=+